MRNGKAHNVPSNFGHESQVRTVKLLIPEERQGQIKLDQDGSNDLTRANTIINIKPSWDLNQSN